MESNGAGENGGDSSGNGSDSVVHRYGEPEGERDRKIEREKHVNGKGRNARQRTVELGLGAFPPPTLLTFDRNTWSSRPTATATPLNFRHSSITRNRAVARDRDPGRTYEPLVHTGSHLYAPVFTCHDFPLGHRVTTGRSFLRGASSPAHWEQPPVTSNALAS